MNDSLRLALKPVQPRSTLLSLPTYSRCRHLSRPRSRSPPPTALCPLLTICQWFYIMSAYTLTNIMAADKSTSASLDRALTLLNDALAPQVLVHYGDASIDSRHPDAGWLELEWLPYSNEKPHRQRLRVVVTSDASNATSIPDTMWILQGSVPATLRDQLRERGTSFVHPASGTVHVLAPGLLIDRVIPRSRGRQGLVTSVAADPFADRPSRIARVLLRSALGPTPRSWGVRELAATSGVDRTTTSRVLERLEQWRLVERARRPGARGGALAVRLLDPVALLERWSSSYDWTSNARLAVHAPIGNLERFLERLPEQLSDMRWALTLHAGGALLAPHAAWDRIHLYVDTPDDAGLRRVAARHDWPTGEDGRLILMRPHYSASLWGDVGNVRGTPVVGIAQLLIDLWRYPVRGREQAEHLLELRHQLPAEFFQTGITDE